MVVTHQRECLFGKIENEIMVLNELGKIVQWEWLDLPKRFRYVELGAYMVMPNHVHGILIFRETLGATRHDLTNASAGNTPLPILTTDGIRGSPQSRRPKPASLGVIISQFKSRVKKRGWKISTFKRTPIWQHNY
ncbi:MAG: hypothetical protein IPJ46_04655 [Anaerolineales bacterium]|nr:hypothetical protein [Anaerolineales bacterium]